MDVLKLATEMEDTVIEYRRWLHQHAELPWKEKETTEFIEEKIKEIGLQPIRFEEGRYGLYTMIHGGAGKKPCKTIMLRADIDALPIQEKTGLEYSSIHDGVMHACGHDCHAAMLLGAAKLLYEHRDELEGNVKLLFQSAEETGNGAEYYVNQGILDDVDAVYASHVFTFVDAPKISVDAGPRCASNDEFEIIIKGSSAHGAQPHMGKDAIVAAAAVVSNLQTIVSRETDPLEPLVISIGTIQGGTTYNVIADRVEMKGTVRTYSLEICDAMSKLLQKVVENTAEAFGCTGEVQYIPKTGPVINDTEMSALAEKAVKKLFGEEGICKVEKNMGSEDFGHYAVKRPGVFAMIGAYNPEKGCTYPQHHECYQIDESILKRGVAMYVQMAVDFLKQ